MDKKGMFLATEVLKMVLAVIGISFLIFLLASIYYSNLYAQDYAQAEALVERIDLVIENVSVGEENSEFLSVLSPVGWTVFSFTGSEKKPNSCAGENCLCVCDGVLSEYLGLFGERQMKECDEKGVCLVIRNLRDFKDFEITSKGIGSNMLLSKQGDLLVVMAK